MTATFERVLRRLTTPLAPLAPIPAAIQDEADAAWRDHLTPLDLPALRARFLDDGELLALPDLLPRPYVAHVLAEIDQLPSQRSSVPFIRSAQHHGWRTLQRIAPRAAALYRSPVFLDWMSALAGRPLQRKDDLDDHACATYEYTRRGDHITAHYDTCGCDEGASYTQILALHDTSTQRLVVDLHTKDDRPVERRALQTPPGTLVVYCGSKVRHAVTPLGAGERRVVLSMSYATDPHMPPWQRVFENVKDAVLYFGPSTLVRGLRLPLRRPSRKPPGG